MEEDEEQLMDAEVEPANPACPMCGGRDLCYGQSRGRSIYAGPAVFFPKDKLSSGYILGAFVCLNCGYVGQFIYREDLEKLRSWVEKKREKAARKQRQG